MKFQNILTRGRGVCWSSAPFSDHWRLSFMAKSTTSRSISAVTNSNSSSFRLPAHLTLPLDLNNFELHESDVIWSSSSDAYSIPSPSNVSTSPPIHLKFNSGLYAALSDEQHSFVRRKPKLSPSESAATAARTIPPVTVRRLSECYSNYHQSAPVNVPVWRKNETSDYLGQFDDEEEENLGEMIPPHEIVARSYVTFSVFEGAGRTIKGRDLCRVRNRVFQKTGLLD